ncbi:MAG: UDP-N-acetylglucosamine--N-acetylmuramyl-(pentapeptide) pyrophosphoryl-undecaprenol N-acetylglucosamine transferase [Parcubacteria group bacterium]
MRILFTGGGTGGHFYPVIAIAEEVTALVKEKRLLPPELFYISPDPYNEGILFEHGITYKRNVAGKSRTKPGILSLLRNFVDIWKTGGGVILSLIQVWKMYPDVVFGKGGFASFPAVLAARILRIPVVIHESDTVPGRVNAWAGKFATRIALSWADAGKYFPTDRVALTGNPVRKDISMPILEGAREFLKLEENVPVILILGGSQGASLINDIVIEDLPNLLEKYQVIHQTGAKNLKSVEATAKAVLLNSTHKGRYKAYDYLNPLAMRMAAGVASVVVSRAGSTIFEIAAWGVPAILVPITNSNGDHQRHNAFAYARAGACEVIEEANFTAHILSGEIERLVTNVDLRQEMVASAKAFYKPNAARLVAEEIVKIALSHEIE